MCECVCVSVSVCECVCMCAIMCMHDRHVAYIFVQAVWSMFMLIVNITAVY